MFLALQSDIRSGPTKANALFNITVIITIIISASSSHDHCKHQEHHHYDNNENDHHHGKCFNQIEIQSGPS